MKQNEFIEVKEKVIQLVKDVMDVLVVESDEDSELEHAGKFANNSAVTSCMDKIENLLKWFDDNYVNKLQS